MIPPITFDAMAGRTAPSLDGLLAEVFFSFKTNARRSMHSPRDHFIIILSLAIEVTEVTLGASGLWLGTRTGAAGTATLA